MTTKLMSRTSFADNTIVIEGSVTLNYLAAVDPWLVHMTFQVADAVQHMDVDRVTLISGASRIMMGGQWLSLAGAPFQIGRGTRFVRFKVTDPSNGSYAVFDVDRQELLDFLQETEQLCSAEQERAALAAYVEESLNQMGETP